MNTKLISFILTHLRGTVAAKVNRYLMLGALVALAHCNYLAHLCAVLQIPPEVLAGGAWAVLMDVLQHLRDAYPQSQEFIDPVIEGMDEAGKPVLADTADSVLKADPVTKP